MAAASSSTAQDDSLKYLVLFFKFLNFLIYIIAFDVFYLSARENAVDFNAE